MQFLSFHKPTWDKLKVTRGADLFVKEAPLYFCVSSRGWKAPATGQLLQRRKLVVVYCVVSGRAAVLLRDSVWHHNRITTELEKHCRKKVFLCEFGNAENTRLASSEL